MSFEMLRVRWIPKFSTLAIFAIHLSQVVSNVNLDSAANSAMIGGQRMNPKKANCLFQSPLPLRGGHQKQHYTRDKSPLRQHVCMSSASNRQHQAFFSFEGLIGAGKSTLLAKLSDAGIAIIPEPLDR